MQPNDSNNDNVWISKEEYQRLRSLDQTPYIQSSEVVTEDDKAAKSQRTWQIVLGALLALGLYFSVVTGAAANMFLVMAILVFGGVSLIDFTRSKSVGTPGASHKSFKHNPYKIMFIALLCITVLPGVAMFGLFMLILTLGGGDMGS